MRRPARRTYEGDFEAVHTQELIRIRARREAVGLDADAPRTGFAMSGGGIRAAAFGFGVARALHARGLFDRLDYLSTVSGGGFTGSFLSWLRRADNADLDGGGPAEGREIVPAPALSYLRSHADYLDPAPSGGIDADGLHPAPAQAAPPGLLALSAVVLSQMVLSLGVYGALLMGLFLVLHVGDAWIAVLQPIALLWSRDDAWALFVEHMNLASLLGLGGLALAALLPLVGVPVRALANAVRGLAPAVVPPPAGELWRGAGFYVLGAVTAFLAVLAVFMSEPLVGILSGVPLALVSAYCLRRFYRAFRQTASAPSTPGRRHRWVALLLSCVAALIPPVVLLGAVVYYALQSGVGAPGTAPKLDLTFGALLFVAALVSAWFFARRGLRQLVRMVEHLLAPGDPGGAYRRGLQRQRRLGRLLSWSGVWLLLGSVPWAAAMGNRLWTSRIVQIGFLASALALTLLWFAARVLLPRGRAGRAQPERVRPVLPGPLYSLAAALFLYGFLVLTRGVTEAMLASSWPQGVLLIALLGLVIGLLAQLNFSGPGQLYRDRLSEAFMPDKSAIRAHRWQPAISASTFALADLCAPGDRGPYHLINASITTTGSNHARYRKRTADSFLLSPLFCGSQATGWVATREWLDGRLTLRDAIGISGAAVAPGVSSGGSQGPGARLIASALSLLNLRLGFWTDNPNPAYCPRPSRLRPNLLRPGLRQGVLNRGVSERERQIRLSDGGHFEELGLYELFRRRVPFIIVADSTEDPTYHFGVLGRALERVREDFDVEVVFAPGAFRDPTGEAAEPPGAAGGGGGTANARRRGFALGEILYPEADWVGRLLLIKPALVSGLDVSLESFAAEHPGFPQESTYDQFFSPEHFRAYEALGHHLAGAALDDIGMAGWGEREGEVVVPRDSMFRLTGEPEPSRVGDDPAERREG